MPDTNVAAPVAGGRPEEPSGQSFIMKIVQGVGMYMLMQFAIKQFTGAGKQTAEVKDAQGNVIAVATNTGPIPEYASRPKVLDEGAVFNPIPQNIRPIFPEKAEVDMVVTISPSVALTPLQDTPEDRIVLRETHFRIGNFSDRRAVDTTIQIPEPCQHNQTLWGHFFVGLSGSQLDPSQPGYDPGSAYYFVYPLTQYVPKKKVAKTRSLLAAKNESQGQEVHSADDAPSGPIISNYYHPNHTFSFIPPAGVLSYPRSHPAVRHFLHLEATNARDGSGQNGYYYPILFVNTFWQLKAHMTALNETVQTVPMHIDLNNLANWQFMAMATIELNARETARQAAFGNPLPGGGDGSEMEMIKEIFMDTNPILLGITVVVSIAHLILETLAFGSDIAHYRKKKDNVGISLRSILANVFMQAVIFLYLVDQSQNTSWMILGSQGIGILIELWKVTTVVNVRLRPAPAGSLVPYRLSFEDKHTLSETEEKTKEYDQIAFNYMYMAAVPLLVAYAVYSLFYDTHKSWYSYMITTLVGSVYAYGFLMMVPSLYINYRLKSVAHMPSKAMMYKFLNTFIDDLFAFTIKMPLLHRLATFRDDIIFFVYLYQRWAYKVDYTRVNEFGQGGDDKAVADEKRGDAAALPSVPSATEEKISEPALKATGVDTGGALNKRK